MKKTVYLSTLFTFLFQFLVLFAQDKNELINEAIFREFLKSESPDLCLSILKNPDNSYTNFCKAFLSKNDKEKIKLFTSFIELKPNYGLSKAYFYRGIANQNAENYKDSEFDLLKAIELNENNFYSYFMLGITQRNLDKFKEALINLDKAIELNENVYFIYHLRGLTQSELGNYEDAIDDYNESLKLEPNNVQCYLDLAECYLSTGQKDEALESIEKAKQLDKNDEYKIFIDRLLSKVGT
ncbi:MAG: tetratricopeptide repeat protein [Ignavibacteriaceae bacterium]